MRRTEIPLTNPNFKNLSQHIQSSAARHLPFVPKDHHADSRGVIVCGSGPSLVTESVVTKIRQLTGQGWHTIACKEAIRLLRERDLPVHYSISMDPGDNQWRKTHRERGIVYCVASSCHPSLFDYLLEGGCEVWLFHSACGWPTEVQMYRELFPKGGMIAQGGYTVVNRGLAVAKYMAWPRIVLAGGDFGWRPDPGALAEMWSRGEIDHDTYLESSRRGGSAYYADGATEKAGNAGSDMIDHGVIDGRVWYSRPDLIGSAIPLARSVQRGDVERVLGDSMVASLARRDEELFRRILPNA